MSSDIATQFIDEAQHYECKRAKDRGLFPADHQGRLERRADGWWIVGYLDDPDMGPYTSIKDADSDLRGLRRSEPRLQQLMAATTEELPTLRRRLGIALLLIAIGLSSGCGATTATTRVDGHPLDPHSVRVAAEVTTRL